jgi:hypothetical protein
MGGERTRTLSSTDRGRALAISLAASVAAVLLFASTAQAAFHLMKIREVHTGGASGGSYVVLQMFNPGQNLVGGHKIDVYASNGTKSSSFEFPGNVASGADQATILAAGEGYAASFPSGPAPDAPEGSALDLPAAGGAVCFESIDCVSWGGFTGNASLPFPGAGTPVSSGGVTAGKVLRRSIEPGCSTLLELGDDTNDSATDFSEQAPNPRSNATVPVETECNAPNTTIDSASVPSGGRTSSPDVTFEFSATPSEGATFECKLDGGTFAGCTSPAEYNGLEGGPAAAGKLHTFMVQATIAGDTDPTPATHSWTVDKVAPTMTITAQPDDPSPGGSAAFAYFANESVAGVECRLDTPEGEGTFESCPSGGKTYTGLGDGPHTFMVRATDLVGNQGTPGEFPSGAYSWTVDNSLADTTPPETTILLKPPNPTGSSTVFFTYASNEPGSTFECRLDGAPFVGCTPLGVTYTGLASGTHTFEVQAKDEAGNLGKAAGYTFDVVLPTPAPPPPGMTGTSSQPSESQTAPGPGTAFAAGVAKVKGAFALLRMGCRGQRGARCRGRLRLVARVGGARASRRATRNLVVGRGRYNLPAGSRGRVVRVRLSAKGRRLVRRAGRRGLRVRLAGKRLKKRSLVLRGAAKKRRRR